jgi:hypothetical protein
MARGARAGDVTIALGGAGGAIRAQPQRLAAVCARRSARLFGREAARSRGLVGVPAAHIGGIVHERGPNRSNSPRRSQKVHHRSTAFSQRQYEFESRPASFLVNPEQSDILPNRRNGSLPPVPQPWCTPKGAVSLQTHVVRRRGLHYHAILDQLEHWIGVPDTEWDGPPRPSRWSSGAVRPGIGIGLRAPRPSTQSKRVGAARMSPTCQQQLPLRRPASTRQELRRLAGGDRRRVGVEARNLDETNIPLGGDLVVEGQPPVIG